MASRGVVARLRAELNPVEYIWGLMETSRATQLLPARFRPAQLSCPPGVVPDAPTSRPGDGFLGASRSLFSVTILCNPQ